MKKETDINIDALLRDTFLTVVELRQGTTVRHGMELYRHCQRQVELVRERLKDAGFSRESVEHITYAQCALLDETVLSRSGMDDGQAIWMKDPLQSHFFNTLQAGELLYERMKQVLQEPAPAQAVLTCFHRVLLLGFRGRYQDPVAPERDQLISTLNGLVAPFGVLPETAVLNGPEAKCPPLAMAVGLVPSLPEVDNNLWQSWITARTGLTTDIADTGTDATLPFPDALLRRLPRQSGFTPLRRACVTMLGITTVAGIAALCLSATANRQLLRHIGDDLHQFYAVPAEEFITKARRLSVLKDDAVMLDGYYREGEPLRLGLGLYPGEQIRQPVLRAIRDYRPPEQKMEVTASLQAQTVRLDSMSLFDVGQARLKDGSTKVLVDALVNIRAKPGWLILVAGYTDATGDEKSNQQLSLRRAEAVRNWMLQTSDIPATCFAVQGLGESQPAATNDTPQGRAVNRRVEISLVPRSDACQDVK
ncbi:TPA: OmpA family protein [Escherichia coli]|nr:OmpA family protein [Escherichia coli]HAW2476671.1 OmpA family protein [Escherichia coli]